MVTVDARGLSCPEPVMLTQDALKKNTGSVQILVDEPTPRINVEKCVKRMGRTSTTREVDGYFEITVE